MSTLNRRVLVGLDSDGRSTTVADARDMALAHPPTGVRIQEVWRQERIPARLDDTGAFTGPVDLAAPAAGAVIRILTVPPSPQTWTVDLHYDDSMHVITMTDGELEIVLETSVVILREGDTIVLPASVHDLHNPSGNPATFIYTSFPLSR